MIISYTLHYSLDSDIMFNAAQQANLDMTKLTKESLEELNGKELFYDLSEEIKKNPNILLGIIQMMKTTFNSAPTEPPIVQQEPGTNIPSPPETPII